MMSNVHSSKIKQKKAIPVELSFSELPLVFQIRETGVKYQITGMPTGKVRLEKQK